MLDREKQKAKVNGFINVLIDKGYFGDLIIKFERGNIVHLRAERNLKVDSLNIEGMFTDYAGTRRVQQTGKYPIKKIIEGKKDKE